MTSTAALPALLDGQHLVQTFGLAGMLAVVFAETGLLLGFFLPSDSLLFAAVTRPPATNVSFIDKNLEVFSLLIVGVSVLPPVLALARSRRTTKSVLTRSARLQGPPGKVVR